MEDANSDPTANAKATATWQVEPYGEPESIDEPWWAGALLTVTHPDGRKVQTHIWHPECTDLINGIDDLTVEDLRAAGILHPDMQNLLDYIRLPDTLRSLGDYLRDDVVDAIERAADQSYAENVTNIRF